MFYNIVQCYVIYRPHSHDVTKCCLNVVADDIWLGAQVVTQGEYWEQRSVNHFSSELLPVVSPRQRFVIKQIEVSDVSTCNSNLCELR